jgi:hypothetical protein
MRQALCKTLARKLRISVAKVHARYGTVVQTEEGPRKVLQVTVARGEGRKPLEAHWGGISLRWRANAVLDDQPLRIWNDRTELVQRLLAETCELCGSQEHVEVHHVRALKRPPRSAPSWSTSMGRVDGDPPTQNAGALPILPS